MCGWGVEWGGEADSVRVVRALALLFALSFLGWVGACMYVYVCMCVYVCVCEFVHVRCL